jgi:competence protein ComEC
MPFANLRNIHADIFSTIMLYVVIIGACFFLLKQRKYFLKLVIFSSLVFTSCISIAKWKVLNQNKMIVYNMPNQNIVDIISGNSCYTFFDKNKIDFKRSREALNAAHLFYEVKPTDTINTTFVNNKICWRYRNNSILFLDTGIIYKEISPKIKVDFIIISQSPKLKMAQLLQSIKPSLIIFDATNKMWKISKWKRECEALNLRCYSVPEQGAFVYNFK